MKNKKLIIIILIVLIVVVAAVIVLSAIQPSSAVEGEDNSTAASAASTASTSTINQIHTAEGAGMNAAEYSAFIESIKHPTESGSTDSGSEDYIFTKHTGTSDDPIPVGEWVETTIPTKENATKTDAITALVRVTKYKSSSSGTTIDYEIIVPEGYPLAQGNSFYPRTMFKIGEETGKNESDVTPNCRAGYIAKGKWTSTAIGEKATLITPTGKDVFFVNVQ